MSPESKREFVPVEGEDYIIDLYAIARIDDHGLPQDQIAKAINEQRKKYHPDRYEGLAEEHRASAERTTVLLNRAKAVLGDPERRQEYDQVLNDWDGLVSRDGTPMYTSEAAQKFELTQMSEEEIEARQGSMFASVAEFMGYAPDAVNDLTAAIEALEAADPNSPALSGLRSQLTEALLTQDEMLSLQEDLDKEVMGIDISLTAERHQVGHDYLEETTAALERAIEAETEARFNRLALESGVATTRLALISGADQAVVEGERTEIVEPTDKDKQIIRENLEKFAASVLESSRKRIDLAERIIENEDLIYPEEDLQDEFKEDLIVVVQRVHSTVGNVQSIGPVQQGDVLHQTLIHVRITDKGVITGMSEPDDESTKAIEEERYKDLIEAGHNIVIFENKTQLEIIYIF